jgi:hypothetical protein
MKLNVKGFALATGILWGLSVVLLTLISLWHGGGGHLGLLSLVYVGYTVSYLGSLIGLVYGFVDGVIAGALFAWLYNRLATS